MIYSGVACGVRWVHAAGGARQGESVAGGKAQSIDDDGNKRPSQSTTGCVCREECAGETGAETLRQSSASSAFGGLARVG